MILNSRTCAAKELKMCIWHDKKNRYWPDLSLEGESEYLNHHKTNHLQQVKGRNVPQITPVHAQVREHWGERFRRAPYFIRSCLINSKTLSKQIRKRQSLTNWMRPNRTGIHPEKGNSNKCAIPSKPKDSVSQLESFRVFFKVVLMEINVWNWLAIFLFNSLVLQHLRKCHSLITWGKVKRDWIERMGSTDFISLSRT